jgi:hypothetical protein
LCAPACGPSICCMAESRYVTRKAAVAIAQTSCVAVR